MTTSPSRIPEAAVEAAARAAFERWHPERSWEASPALQEIFKRDAILHLEAAAPHMQAEVWRSGYVSGLHNMEFNGIPTPNPYRVAP